MSDESVEFTVLPWTIPASQQNFVPNYSRLFTYSNYSIFLAWRNTVALIFTFESSDACLSKQHPMLCQVISSRERILDIVLISRRIYFVSSSGLFQALHSKSRHLSQVLENLVECKSFAISDAFELSPLKKLLAVTTIPVNSRNSHDNFFVAITQSIEGSKIDAELYSVSQISSLTKIHVESVIGICKSNTLKVGQCFASFVNSSQATNIFHDLKEAEILLVGLSSGHLYSIPFYIAVKKKGVRPSARLMYQSRWRIDGLSCPREGSKIFIFLEGGTVVSISKQSGEVDAPPTYNSFSLPYPMKYFAAPSSEIIFVSDAITTSVVRISSPGQVDICSIPVRGTTALSVVPGTNLVIAATSHNSFYILDHSRSIQRTETISLPWAGCSLDVSLQLVEDMKVQTELLSQIKGELKEEDNLIKALSAVTRAPLMADYFVLTAKVTKTFGEHGSMDFNTRMESFQQTYQISVEIENNSPEDFNPLLWKICIEIRNPDGKMLMWNIPLSVTFTSKFPFSTVINVPYSPEELSFPAKVMASLVGQIRDNDLQTYWLKVNLGMVTLDISHFFTVLLQPPQIRTGDAPTLATFLSQIQLQDSKPESVREDQKEKAAMSSYTLPIPEKFRQPKVIMEKLLSNCQHRQQFAVEKDYFNQNDKTVVWLCVLQKNVQVVFRKSCASISINSTNLELLHSVKLCLAAMFGDIEKPLFTNTTHETVMNNAHGKAKSLNAVLELLSLDEIQDRKQLLGMYQDLRGSVSSQIF